MNTRQAVSTLGFVGLGVMGRHMCRNLIEKSQPDVYLFDKSQTAVDALVQHGGIACGSLSELGEAAEIVFLSLPNTQAVEEVCLGESGLCSGKTPPKIIVDMGTSDVETTRRIGQRLEERNIRFIDAPVARMPEAAHDGTLLIMVGADQDAFSCLHPYLRTMGTDIVRCGELGAGQTVKIINNFVLVANVNTLAEALLIGEKSGIAGDILFNTLLLGSGSSEALKVAGIRGLVPRSFPAGRFSAIYALKDLNLAHQLADSAGVQAEVLDNAKKRLQRAIDRGNGDQYYPVMIEEIQVDKTC